MCGQFPENGLKLVLTRSGNLRELLAFPPGWMLPRWISGDAGRSDHLRDGGVSSREFRPGADAALRSASNARSG